MSPTDQPHGLVPEGLLLRNGIVTAEIFYWMPDYPHLVQEYIWQDYDQLPEIPDWGRSEFRTAFPQLRKFLTFWRQKLEGPLKEVHVSCAGLIHPRELRFSRTIPGLVQIH